MGSYGPPGPTVLMVLDGWGMAPPAPDNAITAATAPNFFGFWERFPHSYLTASGRAVGLSDGQMGDSNVGHLTLGAGRVVKQNLVRIHDSIADGSFFRNPVLLETLANLGGGRLHLAGMVSHGGVHSHLDHLRALLQAVRQAGLPPERVAVHAWLDGRDVPPGSAPHDLAELMEMAGPVAVASVAGRYYAMDRDRRWDRTRRAFAAMVEGQGPTAASPLAAVEAAYAAGVTDEFVPPTVIVGADGRPLARVGPEDTVLVFNFRADRVRQITRALADPDFAEFARPFPRVRAVVGMTPYDEAFPLPHLFGRQRVPNNLAAWLAAQGWRQLHVAETEKYAHVTYFFNGGEEEPVPGEDRVLVPSPKVATYDLQPEMSAPGIAEKVLQGLDGGRYRFILCNFANSDMVGHTGNLAATKAAVAVVDRAMGAIAQATQAAQGLLAIVADHGNAEAMTEPDGGPNTNHTTNPVPFVLVGDSVRGGHLVDGELADVAPTLLNLWGVPVPPEMTGHNLFRPPAGGSGGNADGSPKRPD